MPRIHERLIEDHRRLHRLFASLSDAFVSIDDEVLRHRLAEFETGLVAHFEGEEKYLFPLLEVEFPDEVRALREEHEAVRRQLAELQDMQDARRFDEQMARRMLDRLDRHARREDGMLYTIVSDAETNETYQRLIAYLEDTYEKLRGVSDESSRAAD